VRTFTSAKPDDVSGIAEGTTGRLAWTRRAGALLRELWDIGIPNAKGDVGLGNVDNTSDTAKPISTATSTALAAKADLVGGLLRTDQLPPLAISDVFTVSSQAAMLALTAQRGDVAVRSDLNGGTQFILAADAPGTLANWVQLGAAGQVLSVAGRAGAVVLSTADLASGTLAVARATPGSVLTVDYVRSDGYAGANAWPTSRPSSRTDVYFRLTGPRSAFPADTTAAPYSWLLDGDEPAYEDA